MVQYPVRAGIDSYLVYGKETTFGTAASSFTGNFGIITSFNATPKRNVNRIRGVVGTLPAANTTSTARDAQFLITKEFSGDLTVEFIPQEWSWLEAVMGTVSGAGTGASPFNYPQATASVDADKRKYLKIPSLTFSTNYYFEGSSDSANKMWRFLGAKVDACTIKGKFGDIVSASTTSKFANMTGSPTFDAGIALAATEPYNFTGVSIEYPTGTPIPNIIDSFDLTINNSIEMLYGIGSDIGKAAKELARDFSLKIVMRAEGTAFLDDFMGSATTITTPAEIAEIKITLTSTTADKNLVIHCLRCKLDDDSLPNTYPNVVDETITVIPQVIYFEEQSTT